MSILVTGGAGFIGTNFILQHCAISSENIINLDAQTYAASQAGLAQLLTKPQHHFHQGNIQDKKTIQGLLEQYRPKKVVHFAAQTHVDRSIQDSRVFVETNVVGTHCLLEELLAYWRSLPVPAQKQFSYLQISTDEVYGSLLPHEPLFTETSLVKPSNPYSATKASADHLALSYHHTHGLPVVIARPTNNYGCFQHPEKLIPKTIFCALSEQSIIVYQDGQQIRDWLSTDDHCQALQCLLRKGLPGEIYNISSQNPQKNISVVHLICQILSELKPRPCGQGYEELIQFSDSRPGHDQRYGLDTEKIEQLGFVAQTDFGKKLRETIMFYLDCFLKHNTGT